MRNLEQALPDLLDLLAEWGPDERGIGKPNPPTRPPRPGPVKPPRGTGWGRPKPSG
jgi:hypothetical protein